MRHLNELTIGESGYIRRINGADERILRKLTDMGLTPGTMVKLEKYAPMGDPMEIHLRGYSLSLRKDDAAMVELMSEAEESYAQKNQKNARADYEAEGKILLAGIQHSDRCDESVHERAERLTGNILNASCSSGGCAYCHSDCANSLFKKNNSEQDEIDSSKRPIRLALVGNPNCGKTTLFNAMTGEREYVGNWAGVTVEKKEGKVKSLDNDKHGLNTDGHEMILVDLPGIYSLSPFGMEERIARQYIVEERPDAIINIVDATNLQRNLYLTIQLLELERPMVIALNMMDEVEKNGDKIDCEALSKELGIPVVPISARTGEGLSSLVSETRNVSAQLLLHTAHAQLHEGFMLEPDHIYDDYTHSMHHRIGSLVEKNAIEAGLPIHWVSIKLLEGDEPIANALKLPEKIRTQINEISDEYAKASGIGFADSASMLADNRYRYIESVTRKVLKKSKPDGTLSASDKIDRILTNKYLALPLFFVIMGIVFTLTFGTLGAWLKSLMEQLIFDIVIPATSSALSYAATPSWLNSLVCEGILSGVGGVVTFLPEIAILFFMLSLLEDSGYMSRIAFIMDKPMRKIGLSGKSFIPLLMGFGCTVPATMAARTMENMQDKRNTIILVPFMSCSAKLPVYALIAGAFFSKGHILVVLSLYIGGIILAALFGLLFKKTLFKDNDAAFMMELPPYRMPKFRDTMLHVWERVKHFLVKAGTLIFIMSVLVWLLMHFSFTFSFVGEHVEKSILSSIGSFIAPAFKPLGFGNWMAVVALLTGFIAKESVVSTLSVLVGSTLTTLNASAALSSMFTPLSAYSFLVFVSLYTPCIAAISTMSRELQSKKYTAFTIVFQIAVAYLAALIVHTLGLLFV